mgnify:CR=1 FL=1
MRANQITNRRFRGATCCASRQPAVWGHTPPRGTQAGAARRRPRRCLLVSFRWRRAPSGTVHPLWKRAAGGVPLQLLQADLALQAPHKLDVHLAQRQGQCARVRARRRTSLKPTCGGLNRQILGKGRGWISARLAGRDAGLQRGGGGRGCPACRCCPAEQRGGCRLASPASEGCEQRVLGGCAKRSRMLLSGMPEAPAHPHHHPPTHPPSPVGGPPHTHSHTQRLPSTILELPGLRRRRSSRCRRTTSLREVRVSMGRQAGWDKHGLAASGGCLRGQKVSTGAPGGCSCCAAPSAPPG